MYTHNEHETYLNRTIFGYEFIEYLNEGNHANVYKVVDTTTNAKYAAKCIYYKYDTSIVRNIKDVINYREDAESTAISNEIKVNQLIKFADPANIIPILKIKKLLYHNGHVIFILPLCYKTINEIKVTNYKAIAKILFRIAYGIYFLHNSVKYIHGDLMPCNIISSDENLNVFISDLGLALPNGMTGECNYPEKYGWHAPEITFDNYYHKAIDSWYIGHIAITLIRKLIPGSKLYYIYTHDNKEFLYEYLSLHDDIHADSDNMSFSLIKRQCGLPILKNIDFDIYDEDFITLLRGLYQFDYEKRFTPEQIINSDFINKYYPQGIEIFENYTDLSKIETYVTKDIYTS